MDQLVIKPFGDRYIIDPIAADQRSPGGLILPETAQKAASRGKIVAIGDKATKGYVDMNETVMFSSYAAAWIDVNDKKLAIVREHDLIARGL